MRDTPFIAPPHVISIDPNDNTDLPHVIRCFWVAGAGDVQVTTSGGETIVLPAASAGGWHACQIKRIWVTNTTATGIIGGY